MPFEAELAATALVTARQRRYGVGAAAARALRSS
jgi:hypothetical protein